MEAREGFPYLMVGDARPLAYGYKSWILVFDKGVHDQTPVLLALKYRLGCSQRSNNTSKKALISVFTLDFRWSLESGLPVRAPFLKSANNRAFSVLIGLFSSAGVK